MNDKSDIRKTLNLLEAIARPEDVKVTSDAISSVTKNQFVILLQKNNYDVNAAAAAAKMPYASFMRGLVKELPNKQVGQVIMAAISNGLGEKLEVDWKSVIKGRDGLSIDDNGNGVDVSIVFGKDGIDLVTTGYKHDVYLGNYGYNQLDQAMKDLLQITDEDTIRADVDQNDTARYYDDDDLRRAGLEHYIENGEEDDEEEYWN